MSDEKTKTHWKKAFNKEYLGAHDLCDDEELKLVIKQVIVKEIINVGGEKDTCNVAYFTDPKIKPMIFNATACKQISGFSHSKYINDWPGVAIQVYVLENAQAYGDIMDVLRIRSHQPRMEKPKLTPESEKWQKAIDNYREKGDEGIPFITKHYDISTEHIKKLKTDAANLS